jgi:NAD(P)-dependent dehydrogenase (short-subunit alcohol dehydrogenase family)
MFSSRFILVTGSSTGIGKATALRLASRGYSVLACVRNPADATAWESTSAGKIVSVMLDVTDSASIAAAAERVRILVGDAGLFGLVNNAGIGVVGPVEFVRPEQWREQLEVNVIGVIAVTQAMLPLLRRSVEVARTARIVIIGSIAGRIAQPIVAPYCASKHAIEAVAGALRIELKDQGIQTSLIEPGAIKSEIWRKGQESAQRVAADDPARQRYGRMIDAVTARAMRSAANAIDADGVALEVQKCLERARARARVLVGNDAKMGAFIKSILPDRWFDALLAREFGIR